MNKTDKIFLTKKNKITPFNFNGEVAEVFDDMLNRSIPGYQDLQDIISKFIMEYYRKNTYIYDLGCSTGNTILELFKNMPEGLSCDYLLKAVDKSEEMLQRAREKCCKYNVEWICDGVENVKIENASVVVSNYTIQFVDPDLRFPLLKNIYSGLNNDGILILSEKVSVNEDKMEKIISDLFYNFKLKNNYSRLEIDQKAESLRNVLIPLKVENYFKYLQDCGFKNINIIFKYYNFMSLVAQK